MLLTNENYFSKTAMKEYFSVSQYKSFAGTPRDMRCEAYGLALLTGEYKFKTSKDMLIGSYVDSHFEGTLDVFKAQHPEIFYKNGSGLLKPFEHANTIIARLERDPYFMHHMSGEKQQIFTAELFGVKWKCKVDSIDRNSHITDLKVMKSIRDSYYVKDYGRMSFISFWSIDTQAAIYQKVVEKNIGKKLPFFIAAATKEPEPDYDVIRFSQIELDDALSLVEPNINRIVSLKNGEVEADRCGFCDYCKCTKVLTGATYHSDLILKV